MRIFSLISIADGPSITYLSSERKCMKIIHIENISHRLHDPGNYTHLLFTDSAGIHRLGRVLPFTPSEEDLESLYQQVGNHAGIAIPNGYSLPGDGSCCISIPLGARSVLSRQTSLKQLLSTVESLHSQGFNHLSIDGNSFLSDNEGNIELIFWGDGLLQQHPTAPPEIRAGGFTSRESDLYMVAMTALKREWLMEKDDQQTAKSLVSEDYRKRCRAASAAESGNMIPEEDAKSIIESRFTVIRGGPWQSRDSLVNLLATTAFGLGWACRIVRRASGETGRPLPDMPPGTVTSNPEMLIQNAFKGQGGIEKLLILCDVTHQQEDLTALIRRLSGVLPPGLHLVITGKEPPLFKGSHSIKLKGEHTEALDCQLLADNCSCKAKNTGPAWFGPRCRIELGKIPDCAAVDLHADSLFLEGAWRWVTSHPDMYSTAVTAESLYRLGRYTEALALIPPGERIRKAKILIALGKFRNAAEILKPDDDPGLLASAYRGMGQISRALQILSSSKVPGNLPEIAELYDLSGKPSSGLKPLTEGLANASRSERISIYCSLRNLEMRLGFYGEALEHSQLAVSLSRDLAEIHHLVRSLQARGRTLLVLGRWQDAEADFSTASDLCRDNALLQKRPVQVDLFDLQLRMGQITQAQTTLADLEGKIATGGVPGKQMLLMLNASLGIHLGKGELALPDALKAEEIASSHGMELYSGISTLYAGILYIQAGKRKRGIELLNKAKSAGHVLGDRHLVCLAEIELLIEGSLQSTALPVDRDSERNLTEEHLILNIIRKTEVESSFEQLLLLPSPFTACRLADRCGFPQSAKLTRAILKSREQLFNQLTAKDGETFLSTFNNDWSAKSERQKNRIEYPVLLEKVSEWISDYNEGLADLIQLKNILNLTEISLTPAKGLTRVSGKWPLFISGENTESLLPVLLPAAAVLASGPAAEQRSPQKADPLSGIIGDSTVMRKVRFEIHRYAQEDVPILLTGETGTGKEVCAREIHRKSTRRSRCFVPVDCGAIPENLMESEFFGAAAGAYTGIQSTRKGILEEADGGTLFLDELGNLPLHMQAKLLRVLDTGVFRRLGETRERKTDLRIVAASNSNMERQLEEGLFRRDLFYRLAVIRIHLPPLRDRFSDLEQLAVHFSGKSLSPAALSSLMEHRWPGNVRELQNVMKRAAINSGDSSIRKCHISIISQSQHSEGAVTLQQAIKNHVRKTVESMDGNRSKAAKALGCDPKTLRKYLNQ